MLTYFIHNFTANNTKQALSDDFFSADIRSPKMDSYKYLKRNLSISLVVIPLGLTNIICVQSLVLNQCDYRIKSYRPDLLATRILLLVYENLALENEI